MKGSGDVEANADVSSRETDPMIVRDGVSEPTPRTTTPRLKNAPLCCYRGVHAVQPVRALYPRLVLSRSCWRHAKTLAYRCDDTFRPHWQSYCLVHNRIQRCVKRC